RRSSRRRGRSRSTARCGAPNRRADRSTKESPSASSEARASPLGGRAPEEKVMTIFTVHVVVVALGLGVAIALLGKAGRVVPEYQRIVVFRLGRALGAKGPGLVLLIPFVDRGVVVDLRERFFDVQPQTTITSDNAHLAIDFLVYSKVVDALSSVLNVVNYEGASRGIAITTLRAVVGSMLLDDVLANREAINAQLRGKLDEVTNRWGIKVTAVEIR